MMRSLVCAATLSAAFAAVVPAQDTPFFATPASRGVTLRWVWPDGAARPAGYFVERRASSATPWVRLTPRPVSRVRDRAAARALMGDRFDRFSGLLFPDNPAAERADPETFRGMLLLSADLEPAVAHVLGLRYDDTDAAAGSAYEYRLIALAPGGERVVGTSGAVIAGGYRAPSGPVAVIAVSGSRGAALRWQADARFSGYHVYRAPRRDGADARRINDAPVIVFTREDGSALEASATFFTDTAPPADSSYYRIRGIDMFGRMSEPSAPAAFAWRPPVVIAPPVLLQSRVQADTVVISWEPSSGTRATRYQLWRSDSADGAFVRVGTPVRAPAREQRDPGRPPRRVSWYRLTALDDAGRESEPSALALAEVPDRAPPPPPDSLAAAADTGRIILRWRQVAVTDLRGYRVYRGSTAEGTFLLLSPTPHFSARFVDTIPARADHPFYYRVTAVDSAFNESAPSDVVVVRPPDVTPPSAPRIATARKLEGAVAVDWLPNPEPDLASYRLRYRAAGASAWSDAPPVAAAQRSDTITGLAAGQTYQVTVIATDDAGNPSPPAPVVTVSAARPRQLERPDLRGAAFDARRGVVITWSSRGTVREVLIFRRGASERSYRAVGSVPAGVTQFVDRTAKPGMEYEYLVRARDAFGNEAESRTRRVQTGDGGRR